MSEWNEGKLYTGRCLKKMEKEGKRKKRVYFIILLATLKKVSIESIEKMPKSHPVTDRRQLLLFQKSQSGQANCNPLSQKQTLSSCVPSLAANLPGKATCTGHTSREHAEAVPSLQQHQKVRLELRLHDWQVLFLPHLVKTGCEDIFIP